MSPGFTALNIINADVTTDVARRRSAVNREQEKKKKKKNLPVHTGFWLPFTIASNRYSDSFENKCSFVGLYFNIQSSLLILINWDTF